MLNKKILIEGLEELASAELQRRFWVEGSASEISSFAEAVCSVFDDAGLSRALESGYLQSNYSKEVQEKVTQLGRMVSKIPTDLSPQEIMKHQSMHVVRRLSKELIEILEQERAWGCKPNLGGVRLVLQTLLGNSLVDS